MPNLHPIPEADLPPISADRHFVYCPNPLELTDEQLNALFPRQQRIEFLRGIAQAIRRRNQRITATDATPERTASA